MTTWSLLRHAASRTPVLRRQAVRTATRGLAVLSEREQALQEKGILDDLGLVNFDTLHEMQTRACDVYAEKQLFGTYSAESKQFEWMNFAEYAHKVEQCRAVLKDLGE